MLILLVFWVALESPLYPAGVNSHFIGGDPDHATADLDGGNITPQMESDSVNEAPSTSGSSIGSGGGPLPIAMLVIGEQLRFVATP